MCNNEEELVETDLGSAVRKLVKSHVWKRREDEALPEQEVKALQPAGGTTAASRPESLRGSVCGAGGGGGAAVDLS